MNCSLGRIVAVCSLLLSSAFWMPLSAQTGAAAVPPSGPPPTITPPVVVTTPAAAPTTAEVAHQTSHERRKLALAARQSVIDGEKLLSIYNYDDAADRFQY